MEVFANYDILDYQGNKVADGHKASFCLEDVECMPGASKRYECVGYSDQGTSDNMSHFVSQTPVEKVCELWGCGGVGVLGGGANCQEST